LIAWAEYSILGAILTGERVERRLAAVLAADVAGYSRLMGTDEEGTLSRLKAVRKALVDPTIAAHRGRIVKTTGDGMLIEFASAVRSAVEVQRGMADQNASVPQDQRIEFRIGIPSLNIERGLHRHRHFRCRPRRPLKVRWRRRLLLEAIVIPASSLAGTTFRERRDGERQPKDGPQKRPRRI
jgi:hypothetical protein